MFFIGVENTLPCPPRYETRGRAKRQSELKISEANAGAKLPECIACPDNNRDQPANEHRRVLCARCLVVFYLIFLFLLGLL